ncbi:TetR/AcrR family transcriptional regulator [Yinghuangia soli]|uniref:TetR/AcrR family transcriptional regulator n=1 Tax=Yinghuangia soli TaxID=2908204 RepID=A0AA41Q256_9ACTN|nr:TetR/AcrR family transcriptional regulator [Yinghuangia soli]MCF2530170.1 TetR/AcrR family transcriptional regulator [Yinghuangia soli]
MAAPTNPAAGTVRMSADERRAAVIRAAVAEFAKGGLNGTSTAAIAKRVGVSQPYLFRLFDDKKALFLATVDYGFGRVEERFRRATEGLTGYPAMHAMAHAYQDFLDNDSELLRIQLQAYVAAEDPDLRPEIRAYWDRLDSLVREITGGDAEDLTNFFARGMLCNVVASLDLPRERYFGDTLSADGKLLSCELCADPERYGEYEGRRPWPH